MVPEDAENTGVRLGVGDVLRVRIDVRWEGEDREILDLVDSESDDVVLLMERLADDLEFEVAADAVAVTVFQDTMTLSVMDAVWVIVSVGCARVPSMS